MEAVSHHNFQNLVEAEKAKLLYLGVKKKKTKYPVPVCYSEALQLAADLAKQNESMFAELQALRDKLIPQIMLSKHIIEEMEIGASTLSQWSQDPTFPHLDKSWRKGQTIRVLRDELYEWLKNRKGLA